MAGRVTFDEDRCKGCELCTTVCPVKIVIMDTERINVKGYHPATVKEMEKCIGCAFMCKNMSRCSYKSRKIYKQLKFIREV